MGARKRALSVNTERSVPRAEGDDDGELTAKEGPPLSPAGRLFHQPHFNCNIIAMMGFGKTADVDAVKSGLEATIVRHPRFSSILVPDDPGTQKSRWVRTKVVIDNHIVVPNLTPPETSTTTPDQLIEDYVSSLSLTHLPLSQPLWDLHIINMRTSKAESIAILRIHHSLGDGMSLMSLLLACTRKTSDPNLLPSLPEARPRKRGDSTGSKSRVLGLVLWLWALLVHAWNTMVDVVTFVATSAFLSDTETPIKGVVGVEFHQKRFVHSALSLDDIKVVKSSIGCTINDVLVGLVSAGLSHYLNRRYGEISNGEVKEKKNLPTNIRLRSTALVNIRPSPGIHALAEMMEGGKGTRWGNWLGYIILQFPITMYEDPLVYVRKGMEIANRKKKSWEAFFTYTSGTIIVKLLGIKAAAALCYRVLRHTTVSFSNIVGPIEEVGFYGHPLVYIAPSVYGHPQAVTFHFQSYMNKMEMVLAVDEAAVPDPHQLLEDLAASLKLIKEAVMSKSS